MPGDCGYELDGLGKEVSYGGVITPGMPPPKVTIKEVIDEENRDCGSGETPKLVEITLEGNLVCCNPVEKMDVAQSLKAQFKSPCENFSAGDYSYNGARVTNFAISSSDYRDDVRWSADLMWTDTLLGDEVTDKSNVVNASEDDDFVNITQTVSAKGLFADAENCKDCEPECTSGAKDWVEENIAKDDSPPSPSVVTMPKNRGGKNSGCPEVQEQSDPTSCSYSITKTWRLPKRISSSNSKGLKHSECKEESTDEQGKETIKFTGDLSWEGDSEDCGEQCIDLVKDVISERMEEKIKHYKNIYSGKKTNVTRNISGGKPPSGSWSVTVLPEADDGDDLSSGVKDSYSMSLSVSTDGVATAQISGSVSADSSSSASECDLCGAVTDFFSASKYKSKIQGMFSSIESGQPEAIGNAAGPCSTTASGEPAALTLKDEDVDDCDDGSLSFSFTYEKDPSGDNPGGWNVNINETRPVGGQELVATVGGGFCAPSGGGKDGNSQGGSITVSGNRQAGPDCDEGDGGSMGGMSLDYAQRISGGKELTQQQGKCEVTIDGESDKNNFNDEFEYKPSSDDIVSINDVIATPDFT